jgi:hypothetical protein
VITKSISDPPEEFSLKNKEINSEKKKNKKIRDLFFVGVIIRMIFINLNPHILFVSYVLICRLNLIHIIFDEK